jgi:gliding motility-associated-like protein
VLCIGDISTLTATGGTNYNWNTGSTNSVISVSPSTTTTYSVVTSNGSCTSVAAVTVTVSPPPNASANNTTICLGQTATLNASGGINYSWSNGSTTNTILVSPATNTTYSVFVSIGSCKDTSSATVTVNPIPTATAWNNITITSGTSTTLNASGGGNYSWSNGAVGNIITVSPMITTMYCVIVSNGNCTDTACVTVTVEPTDCSPSVTGELYLPNAFSPNDDGENDILKTYFGNYICIKTFEIHIYDRWGEAVYETTNPVVQWDGTFRGKIEGTAVFVYYMKATLISGEEIIKRGNISLIR